MFEEGNDSRREGDNNSNEDITYIEPDNGEQLSRVFRRGIAHS